MEKKGSHVVAETGIHTRPVALLVQVASKSNSDVNLEYKGESVNSKSVMDIMSSDVGQGPDVAITAEGADEADVMAAIIGTMEKGGLSE